MLIKKISNLSTLINLTNEERETYCAESEQAASVRVSGQQDAGEDAAERADEKAEFDPDEEPVRVPGQGQSEELVIGGSQFAV